MTDPAPIDPADLDQPLAPVALAAGQVINALAADLLGQSHDKTLTDRNCRNLARAVPPFFDALAATATAVGAVERDVGPDGPEAADAARRRAAGALRDLAAHLLVAMLPEGGDDTDGPKALAWLRKRHPRLAAEVARLVVPKGRN